MKMRKFNKHESDKRTNNIKFAEFVGAPWGLSLTHLCFDMLGRKKCLIASACLLKRSWSFFLSEAKNLSVVHTK